MECIQVRVAVNDFPLVYRFYRDVMRLTPQVDDERGPYAKFSWPAGGSALALQQRAHLAAGVGDEPASRLGHVLLGIRVEKVDALASELRGRGATLLNQPHDVWGMRVAHVVDPEGNVLELQQWPER